MDGLFLSAAFIVVIGSSLCAGQTVTHAAETALRSSLQSGYDRTTRPYTPTYVDVMYNLRSVQTLNIADQTFSHTGLALITWHDPRLVWNSTVHSGITELDVNWIWRPLFFVGNSVDSIDVHGADSDSVRIMVFSDGTVMWQLMVVTTTACDVNIEFFPYDTQSCSVYLIFAAYENGTTMAFNLSNTMVSTMVYLENAEWELKTTAMNPTAVPVCCPMTSMPFLDVSMTFKRLHAFYVNTLVLPSILLSIGLIWPFYLPTDSGERMGFSLTILLSYTVFLSITTAFLPTTSKQTPHLAVYLLIVLVVCMVATCNVALHVKIFYLETEVTDFVKKLYRKLKPVVFFECKRKSRNKVRDVHDTLTIEDAELENTRLPRKPPISPVKDEDKQDDDEITWKAVSELMDRICLIVYTIVILLVDIVLMVYLSTMN